MKDQTESAFASFFCDGKALFRCNDSWRLNARATTLCCICTSEFPASVKHFFYHTESSPSCFLQLTDGQERWRWRITIHCVSSVCHLIGWLKTEPKWNSSSHPGKYRNSYQRFCHMSVPHQWRYIHLLQLFCSMRNKDRKP